jgi:hypothetical protein
MDLPTDRPPSSRETFEQAIEMLREDRSRGFNIDIETDTMVFEDQKAEKAARVEFIGAVSNFLREAVPAAQLYPQIAPILIELLMFGVRGFKAGQHLEQVFEEATDQLAEAGPQQQKPDPKIQAEQARVEADKARLAIDREDKQLRQKVDFEDVTLRRQADLAFEERRLAIQAAAKPAPAPQPQVDPTAPTEREKFEFDKQQAGREFALKLAGQNKQIMSDAEAEVSGPGQGTKSPMAEMSSAITTLAQAIVESNRTLAEQIAAGQAQLIMAVTAPKRIVKDKTGRTVGVETVAPQSIQ